MITEALDALAAAGVSLSRGVIEQRQDGNPDGALLDAIRHLDEQKISLTNEALQAVRAGAEQLAFNPRTNLRTLLDQALERIEQRSASSAA